MSYCPQCNTPLDFQNFQPGAVVGCPSCGVPLQVPGNNPNTQPAGQTGKFCSDCGHSVSVRAVACPNCGAPLKKSSRPKRKRPRERRPVPIQKSSSAAPWLIVSFIVIGIFVVTGFLLSGKRYEKRTVRNEEGEIVHQSSGVNQQGAMGPTWKSGPCKICNVSGIMKCGFCKEEDEEDQGLFALLNICSKCGGSKKTNCIYCKGTKWINVDISTTAEGYFEEFEINEVAASMKFNGKPDFLIRGIEYAHHEEYKLISITGEVTEVLLFGDVPAIMFKVNDTLVKKLTGHEEGKVICFMRKDQAGAASRIKKGQTISLVGKGAGKFNAFKELISEYVQEWVCIDNCIVVDQ